MIFVDTGAWMALFVRKAPQHGAIRGWFTRNPGELLVTTDYVFAETLTLMRSRGAQAHAVAFANMALSGGRTTFVFVTPDDFRAAYATYVQFADKEWSFTDCTSRVVMERLNIRTALSFDRHFRQFGTVTVAP